MPRLSRPTWSHVKHPKHVQTKLLKCLHVSAFTRLMMFDSVAFPPEELKLFLCLFQVDSHANTTWRTLVESLHICLHIFRIFHILHIVWLEAAMNHQVVWRSDVHDIALREESYDSFEEFYTSQVRLTFHCSISQEGLKPPMICNDSNSKFTIPMFPMSESPSRKQRDR